MFTARQRNAIRRWTDRHPLLLSVMALALLIVALSTPTWPPGCGERWPPYEPVPVYYYDLDSGTLFSAMSTEIPPINAPGSEVGTSRGVRAYVYSCTDCDDESSRFVGYLEMYTPEAKAFRASPETFSNDPDAMTVFEEGQLIRAMNSEMWVQQLSEEGLEVMEQTHTKCDEGVIPQPCLPDADTLELASSSAKQR